MSDPSSAAPSAAITSIQIEEEMTSSFMDYAMSVIVARALPDARDGLKPVHRRVLFAQRGLNNVWNRPYVKSARVVGDVIGKYHPHGDASVYDALVRMAQDFSMRYMLIDGQGNFGSVDGDPPAAMRYTECRMSKLSSELLADIEKETVDWQPNYDDKEEEPTVLPTRVPNLLINGATGIAVGMATSIPPHNLGEILDGVLALIDRPGMSDDELFRIVTGPDFPTGGIIQGRVGILSAYKTGRGSIVVRGRATIEELRKDRNAIVVTELPFMVNKARWIEQTAEMVRDKKLEGIADIRDESDRTGMRCVFELKRDANEQVVLNNLYKATALQSTFPVTMLAIVDGRPVLLTLRRALQVFVDHRRDVVTRRTLFDLREARARREIVEGLGLAVMNIDRVIEIIRASKDTDQAKERLMAEQLRGLDGFLERAGRPPAEVEAARARGFVQLSARQAQAILEMRLGRLTGLERDKLEAEYRELWALTDYLEGLLGDHKKLMAAIVDELKAIRGEFADERRTDIVDAEGEILTEALIDEEDMVVTRTRLGYVKRTALKEYQAQGRGGRGITGAAQGGDDDFVADMFAASTHDHLLLFTSKGRAYYKKVYELPEGGRTSKGKPFVNVIELQQDEEVVAMLPLREFSESRFVFLSTEQGTVKKTALDKFEKIRATGIKAIGLAEDDRLVGAAITSERHDVLLMSARGMAARFVDAKVRPMGREAAGVRGMKLGAGDRVVGMVAFERDSQATMITVCQRGYGNRTELTDYVPKGRPIKGVRAIKTTTRNGRVAAVRIVAAEDHVILISDKGKIIRLRVRDIPIKGRATQGVRVMRVDDGESVAAIERLAEPEDETGIEEGAPIEAADDSDTVPNEVGDLEGGEEDEGEGEGEGDEEEEDESEDEDEGEEPGDRN
ncbi:MAG TPA: DNA gyrase subunit A [Kofleriaceae bacterium]|nr:DNA gyrase subunit A [Kofleriaceae bacterium]